MDKKRYILLIFFLFINSAVSISAFTHALEEFDDNSSAAFVTVARMTSSYRDSPNSLTKLNGRDLELLGIDSMVDALRLVPGMIASDIHGSNSVVGYHGTNVNIPRRMEILFNANSLYRPGYSGLSWHRLPIDISDLSHIEVVRGSSVTDFGSNAFTSTINLVQKSAVIEPQFSLRHSQGDGDKYNTRLGYRHVWENGHYFIRYASNENSGFDYTPFSDDYNDSSESKKLLLSGEIELSGNRVLDWNLASNKTNYYFPQITLPAADREADIVLSSLMRDTGTEEENHIATLKLNGVSKIMKRPLEWHAAYNYVRFKRDQPLGMCSSQIVFDPDLEKLDNSDNIQLALYDADTIRKYGLSFDSVITGPLTPDEIQAIEDFGQKVTELGLETVLAPVCGYTDQNVDEIRQSADLQTVTRLTDKSILSTALKYDRARVISETYLGGTSERETISLSNNLRYQWTPSLVSNLGMMLEHNNDGQEVLTSLRTSLNYLIQPEQTVRFTWAKSKRSPDIYETQRQWNYRVAYGQGFVDYNGQTEATLFRNAVSPSNLEPEVLTEVELAYIYSNPLQTHTVDLKTFYEDRDNLISEPFEYFNFSLTNTGSVKLTGIEAGYQYRSRRWQGFRSGLGYLYLDSKSDTPEEKTLYSRHSGNVWAILPLFEDTHLGLAYVGNTELATGNYSRFDVTLTRELRFAKNDLQIQFNYRHYPSQIRSFTEFSAVSPNTISFDDNDRFFLTLKFEI